MLGAETLDLVQFDVGFLRLRHGGAGDPPVRARQPGRQVGASPGLSMLAGAARARDDLAVRGLPEPDQASLLAEHDSVIPSPDHHLSAVRRAGDGYQVTG